MIQSNMKRSEDIQNTLTSGRFFSNVKKDSAESRRSSISNASSLHGVAEGMPNNPGRYDSVKEYSTQPKARSIHASPKVAKEPLTLGD